VQLVRTRKKYSKTLSFVHIFLPHLTHAKGQERLGSASVAAINHIHVFVDGLGIVTRNFHCRESCAKNKQFEEDFLETALLGIHLSQLYFHDAEDNV
jgi:hypothetical protein